ncbi:MAG: helix-hairpin-helix domain-containing protein [Candidatus Omnitrophica bacterium]|nr:helix-hairpin-helix domain-containing protein [Candidatus Omnitrophota bacterium]
MFNFTNEERKVVVFLIAVSFLGIGINFLYKIHPASAKILNVNEKICKLDLNKASLNDLLCTKLIRPKLCKEIILFREKNGPFESLESLKLVKGIGDKRYEKLKEIFFVQ